MTMLSNFISTDIWQEVTGVSNVASKFTLQNTCDVKFSLYIGDTPIDGDEAYIYAFRVYGSSCIIDNTVTTDKVWVKSIAPVKIVINEG